MLERGLLEEVRGLLERGFGPGLRPLRAIGYRQAVAVVRGEMTVEEAERRDRDGDHAVREAAEDLVPAPAAGRRVVRDADEAFAAVLRWLDEAPAEGPEGAP